MEMKAEGHQCKGTIFFSNSTADRISTFFILDIEPGAKVKLQFHKIYNSRCNLIKWYGEDMNHFYTAIFFKKNSLLFVLSKKKSY